MGFTDSQKKMLDAPLNANAVKSRVQGGRNVSYVDGHHAISEANRILGFDGWSLETIRLEETNRELVTIKQRDGGTKQQWRVGYLSVVKIESGGVVRHGTGFGNGMGQPEAIGDAIESAIKEAETDATKRALRTFGSTFGLALYDKDQRNVADPAEIAAQEAEAAEVAELAKWIRENDSGHAARLEVLAKAKNTTYAKLEDVPLPALQSWVKKAQESKANTGKKEAA